MFDESNMAHNVGDEPTLVFQCPVSSFPIRILPMESIGKDRKHFQACVKNYPIPKNGNGKLMCAHYRDTLRFLFRISGFGYARPKTLGTKLKTQLCDLGK